MKQLLKKLLIIQKAIDGIAKSDKGFNYSYAGQEQVLNTIRPLMNENGLLLMQEVLEVENTRIDYKLSNGKEKSEILTSAKQLFTWMDCDSGETLECRFHANGMNDWEKGLGSDLTYGERYFLLKYFHIATDEDDIDNPERTKANEVSNEEILNNCKDLKSLGVAYNNLTKTEKVRLTTLKDELKQVYEKTS